MADKVFVSMLNSVITHYKIERLPNGSGGWQETFVSQGSLTGRMVPKSDAELDVADQERQQVSHVFYTASPANVDRGDKLVLGLHEYEVLGIREPSLAGHHLEIDCLEWQYERQVDGS